ncbi:unnamed protein product, partial [Rotaria magnacalcarata]
MTQHDHIVEKKEFSIIVSTGKGDIEGYLLITDLDIKNSCRQAAGAGENGRFYGGEGRETSSGAGGGGSVE